MSPALKLRSILPQLALIGGMILWSSSYIALKIAFRAYDPLVVIFSRMLVGSICFLLVGLRYRYTIRYQKGDYRLILFMALCEPCLYFIFEAQAIVYTTASQAGMIAAILPVLVMVSAVFFLNERIRITGWAGALLAVAGAIWLTIESSPQVNSPNPPLGNFLEFLAMVCCAGYLVTMRKLAIRYSPFFLTAVQTVIGAVFFFPLLMLPVTKLPTTLNYPSAIATFYLGAVVTTGAYSLNNWALKYIPASRAASYVNLIPVFSVFWGWSVLGETLSLMQIYAAAVVLAGVWLIQKRESSTQKR